MASDYIKFLSDLHGYIDGDLTFIDPNESKWKDAEEVSGDGRFGTYPVGKLSNGHDAVEIFFLHYSNEREAKEKWERRIERIRWDKLIVKFNDQNGCTEEDIRNFDALPYAHKICFTVKGYPYPSVIKVRVPKNHTFVHSSYEPFHDGKYIQLTPIVNAL